MSWQFHLTLYVYVLIAVHQPFDIHFFHNVVFDLSCNLSHLRQNVTINAVMHWTFNGLYIWVIWLQDCLWLTCIHCDQKCVYWALNYVKDNFIKLVQNLLHILNICIVVHPSFVPVWFDIDWPVYVFPFICCFIKHLCCRCFVCSKKVHNAVI